MKNAAEICTIAIGLYERGFVRASLGTLARGVDQFPDTARIWELQGILLHREEDFAGAEFALETATMLAPLSMAGEYALAACYLKTGHLAAAGAIYEHLHNRRHVPTARLAELASGLARCGMLHQALKVCRQAAELEPDCEEAIYGMAHYMSRLSYPAEQIIPLLQKAVDLAPHEPSYRLALIGWLARTGSFRQAYRQLQAISPQSLESIECTCCLHRLIQVGRVAGDRRLVAQLSDWLKKTTKTVPKTAF
jgi:Flp pilus assembly protein TadD